MQKYSVLQKRVSVETLVIAALFVAMSIVFGKLLKISIGDSIRISFENLPIILASLTLGPIWGGAVGAAADILGCIIVGYSINPLITACAVLIGILPYVILRFLVMKNLSVRVMISVFITHLICSVVLKSIALYIWYKTPFATLIWRLPIYAVTALIEGYISSLLIRRGVFERIHRS